MCDNVADSLRGPSARIGTMQGRLARPLRKDDALTRARIERCKASCRTRTRSHLGDAGGQSAGARRGQKRHPVAQACGQEARLAKACQGAPRHLRQPIRGKQTDNKHNT